MSVSERGFQLMGGCLTSLTPLIGSLVILFAFACAPASVPAQEASATSKTSESKQSDPSSKKDSSNGPGKNSLDKSLPPIAVHYLINGDQLVPVPAGHTWEAFIRSQDEERNKPKVPQGPTISKIDITGHADDERAYLTATFEIRLHQTEDFERVPLYFNEAVLVAQAEYTGDGEERPESEKDPKQGYVWWLKGRGAHQLKLTFSVPLQKPVLSRHLIVSLPSSAVSRIKLTVPYPSITAKTVPDHSIVDVASAGPGKATINVSGLGSRLDLEWKPNIDLPPNEVSLEAQTSILAEVESDRVMLRANQKISSLQGQFDSVAVRLPASAELIKLEDSEKQSYKFDPKNRQRVIVTFKEKVTSAQLNWSVRLPAKLKSRLTIDGFFVEGARKHVGKIGLSIAEGLQLIGQPEKNLPSINVGEFPASMGPVFRAYQFVNQPFKLSIEFDEVKPYFEVKPKLVLSAQAHQLTLDGEFEFRVDRYSMNEVSLEWPHYKSEGWTIDSVDEPGVVESHRVDEKGLITVRLVKHFDGKFAVHVHARRQFKIGDEVAFTMPRPKMAPRISPTTLVVVNHENVESDLMTRGETVAHQLPSSSLESFDLPESARATAYRIDTDEQSFGIRVLPQKQRIRTSSFSQVKWGDNKFAVEQHLYYDVAYERMTHVRLSIPAAIDPEKIKFFRNGDVELVPEFTSSTAGTSRQIQIKLGEAQIGGFEIQARYSIPFAKDPTFEVEALVALPIIESLDEPFSQTRVALNHSDWFDAEVVSVDTWRPQRNRQDAREWVADGQQASLALKLVRSNRAAETGRVSHALLKMVLDGSGEGIGIVSAQFRLSTRASTLEVQLPSTAKSTSFFSDRRPLSDRECVESPAGSRHYVIELGDNADGTSASDHLLTVRYQERLGPAMGWSDKLRLRAPILSNCSWDKVIWQVVLPAGQHLFTYPDSATPLFRWQRTGLVWRRVGDRDWDWLQKWVAAGTPGAPESDEVMSDKNGNSYLFQQLDSPKPLEFQTLCSSMALFFGAGFSLAMGFIALRLVVLRHVLTLLAVGLCIAVVALWYAAPLELLLQPMIGGLLFPVAAVFLEGWIHRRYGHEALSFEGPGEFPALQSFGSPYLVRQADPNEATLHRPAVPENEPSLQIESGSGVS